MSAAPASDLGCRELVELVTAYLEGALRPAERRRLERHLADCEGCRAYLAQLRTVLRAAGRLSERSLPAGAHAPLLRAFRAWKADRARSTGSEPRRGAQRSASKRTRGGGA
ncbi:zf-HC2 domain-containing protein [Anaeromyxobacter oryzae]|uniref:Putative zinc-finger domain-containing protein n=1 Tax=Anaeromyxobacter oryzae TaxID=2918170 RepID=A0ABM7X2R5_9BACT|nr:zf-HC2 domain-containing protein [Anaeromyxobacter oryzae]BDG06073.1 hypothetical protein AMOR_50690 [Anaeromyxobacter oryzae]